MGRATIEPRWRSSDDVNPFANTKSCEALHFRYVSGRLATVMDDGIESDAGPGDVTCLPSGHCVRSRKESVLAADFFGASDHPTQRRGK